MKQFLAKGYTPVDAEARDSKKPLTLWNKLLLGLTLREYLASYNFV